jgi:hypothetical protein
MVSECSAALATVRRLRFHDYPGSCRHWQPILYSHLSLGGELDGFIPRTPMFFFTRSGTTIFPELRKCASITFSGIWAVSNLNRGKRRIAPISETIGSIYRIPLQFLIVSC